MAKMVTALAHDKIMGIDEALTERDNARQRKVVAPQFSCVECEKPVRPFKAGGKVAAHFEHRARNKECSLSDVRR